MEIHRTVRLPEWSEELKTKAIRFWQQRRFRFDIVDGTTLTGRRGSIWGNLVSFDMSKLIACLTLTRVGDSNLMCVLDVNPVLQTITEWNRAYWELEMDTLESWMLRDDLRQDEWSAFLRASRRASLLWVFSLGLAGTRMPDGPPRGDTRD